MSSSTVVVRVRPETRDRLKVLAERRATTAVEALDRIVAREYEAVLLAEMVEGMAQSADDPELVAWDQTVGDGLDELPG
ncbi:MAG: hypothetical protein AB7G37_03775 [Solirubrobacteraceae bacterium]